MADDFKETVSVGWAAKYLGVSVMTILRYREAGRIQGYQMCARGMWRLSKKSILDFEKSLRLRMGGQEP